MIETALLLRRLLWPVLTVLLLAVAAYAAQRAVQSWAEGLRLAGYQQRVNEEQAQALRDSEAARHKEAADRAAMAEKEAQHAQEVERLAADRAAAVSELDRLRLALRAARGTRPADQPAAAGPDRPRPDDAGADGLLAACAGRYEDVAAQAGRLAVKVNGLQEAVRVACPECVGDTAPDVEELPKGSQ